MQRFDLELRVLLAFAFVNGVAESSLVPLLPSVRDDLGLTPVQVGLLLTTTTLAMLLVAMPVGYAANRFGTRVPLLFAAALMPVALIGQAVAGEPDGAARRPPPLRLQLRDPLGDRARARGLGWPGRRRHRPADRRLGRGLARRARAGGPGCRCHGLAGRVRRARGRDAAAAPAPGALRVSPHERRAARRASGCGAALGLVRRNRAIAGAALVSALLGVVGGVSGLLVPLALAANGLSAGAIGLAFGISAAVWIAAAAIVGRLRASAVHLHAVGLAVAVMAAAWLLPAFRLSTLALMAFLVVATASRSTINALNYAVGARASEGNSAPLVMGVMNLAWAVTALVTPLLAGLAEGSAGVRFAFAATAVTAAGVAIVLLLPRPRVRIDALPS